MHYSIIGKSIKDIKFKKCQLQTMWSELGDASCSAYPCCRHYNKGEMLFHVRTDCIWSTYCNYTSRVIWPSFLHLPVLVLFCALVSGLIGEWNTVCVSLSNTQSDRHISQFQMSILFIPCCIASIQRSCYLSGAKCTCDSLGGLWWVGGFCVYGLLHTGWVNSDASLRCFFM